jgi:iron complex transport system substrate-binding protein
VAGFSDVNFEAVLRLRPDLIVLPDDKLANARELERLGLTILPLNVRSLTGYLDAVRELGEVANRRSEAEAITGKLEAAVETAKARAAGLRRPRTLFSVMRSYQGLGYIAELTAVGRDGFFSQMMDFAGCDNVLQGPRALSSLLRLSGNVRFPTLTREAVMTLDPEVIVDLVRDEAEAVQAMEDWSGLTAVSAVRNGRVVMFADEADTVPGPRIGATLAKLSAACHPEADLEVRPSDVDKIAP